MPDESAQVVMKEYRPETFGELQADTYDESHKNPSVEETERTVAFLADLAGGGRVLELAVGTGRVALPLAARGLAVTGIDASPKMIDKLRAKPGGDSLPVTIASIEQFSLDASFDLIFLVFNTLFNLPSQQAQLSCFQCAASHLRADGHFVLEAFVPDLSRFHNDQQLHCNHLDAATVTLEAARHDPAAQRVEYQYIVITAAGVQLFPLPMRYAWPQEMDLMARLAGLELKQRWSGWDKAPFHAASPSHVSVYGWPE